MKCNSDVLPNQLFKKVYFLTLLLSLQIIGVFAQPFDALVPLYNQTKCGLNYIQTSHKVTPNRHVAGLPGTGLPVTFAMNGLPANCVGIEKAYIWYVVSFMAGAPATPTVRVTNPSGTVFTYTASLAGSAPQKCWDEIDTRTFRIDVSNAISGNGNYIVNTTSPASYIDGMTFFIIYSDANATYEGSLIINDGAASVAVALGNIDANLTGFLACANSTTATAFQINSDFQLASHNATLNGTPLAFADEFYNFDQFLTTVNAGQTTSAFAATATGALDCFSLDVIGLYYQTTSCTNCNTPLASTTTVTHTTCGKNNGSATVNLSTNMYAPYVFLWTPGGQTTQTATNLAPGNYSVTVTDLSGCKFTTANVTINPSVAGPASTNTTVNNASCGASDGLVVVNSVNPGVAPFTYNFNGLGYTSQASYNNLGLGNYTVSVRDANGCQFDTSVAIINNGAPTAAALTTANTKCGLRNGSVTAGNITGGVAPYAYSVDNGSYRTLTKFDSLLAGTHNFKVRDANGCVFSRSFSLSNIAGPTGIGVVPVNTTCGSNNGSVTLGAVTGGAAAYSYNFNNTGFSSAKSYPNLVAGTYTIDVSDANQCLYSTSVILTDAPGPTAIAYITADDTCETGKGSTTLGKISGGKAPYQFDFDNTGFSTDTAYFSLSKGKYPIVIMDDNGCLFSDTIAIVSIPGPSSVQANTVSDSCNMSRGSVLISAVGGGTNPYLFNFNNMGYSSQTQYNGLKPGNYPLRIADNYGCGYDSFVVVGDISCEIIPPEPAEPEVLIVTDVFTPNGDGINDIFKPYFENIVNYELLIFNRWGERIFESKKVDFGWDGTSGGSGELVPQGAYIYLIKARGKNGKLFDLAGVIMLVK